jgi:hypothetical protein
VPIDLLLYRKDNGRIRSDVLSYEQLHHVLDENNVQDQIKLAEFLQKKNESENETLRRLLDSEGQIEPAVITADGFLINGNRRKLILKQLGKKFMRVAILPDAQEQGGEPTVREIEEIELRYQLRKEGKAEYSGVDKALSMRMKMEKGMDIEAQLKDDPQYQKLSAKKLAVEVRKIERDLIRPLECAERYLACLNREKVYNTISERWTAFIDLSNLVDDLKETKYRLKLGIEVKQIGTVEQIGFMYIRKQNFAGLTGRINDIIRGLKPLLANADARHELMRLKAIETNLGPDEKIAKDGSEWSPNDVDAIWGKKNETELTSRYKKSRSIVDHEKETELPINLLRAAWDKLNHDTLLDPSGIALDLLEEAERLARDIKKRAENLEKAFFAFKKEKKKHHRGAND